jgi:hypothetical protein
MKCLSAVGIGDYIIITVLKIVAVALFLPLLAK